jgi:predicted dehydrogenase
MNHKDKAVDSERRAFLKTATAAAAGFPAIISAQSVTNAIKVGLVGCGGRGSGAALQALRADDYTELTSVADIDQGQIDKSLAILRKVAGAGDRVRVARENQHLGLDAFQGVIADTDAVLLATPPGFRPVHLAACMEASKHVFCEKPVAVDATGVRSALQSAEVASRKNLSYVSGFTWRYNNMVQETFEEIHNGVLGKLVAYYATYYTNPIKMMPGADTRPPRMSDIEWQIRNWYNFVWLGGDSLVEQAVHSADKIAWSMRDEPPVSCVGIGGRTIPAEGGNIYDHFEINYLYPNGFRAFLASRQMEGCHNENSDYILGADGTCTLGRGALPRIEGKQSWTFSGRQYNAYQREHDVLFSSIRQGKPANNGKRMATSTLLAIMGRMAAYTGQEITWEQALNSQEKLGPNTVDWNGNFEASPRAQPGITKFA